VAEIRALAICVFSNNGRILAAEGYDSVKKQTFYRPLGGMIEFGEPAEEALRREIGEEIAAEIASPRLQGVTENIFVYEGEPGHEIVFVFDAEFVDRSLYEREVIEGDEFGQRFKAVWKKLGEFSAETPLYPDGLLELLQQKFAQRG